MFHMDPFGDKKASGTSELTSRPGDPLLALTREAPPAAFLGISSVGFPRARLGRVGAILEPAQLGFLGHVHVFVEARVSRHARLRRRCGCVVARKVV